MFYSYTMDICLKDVITRVSILIDATIEIKQIMVKIYTNDNIPYKTQKAQPLYTLCIINIL